MDLWRHWHMNLFPSASFLIKRRMMPKRCSEYTKGKDLFLTNIAERIYGKNGAHFFNVVELSMLLRRSLCLPPAACSLDSAQWSSLRVRSVFGICQMSSEDNYVVLIAWSSWALWLEPKVRCDCASRVFPNCGLSSQGRALEMWMPAASLESIYSLFRWQVTLVPVHLPAVCAELPSFMSVVLQKSDWYLLVMSYSFWLHRQAGPNMWRQNSLCELLSLWQPGLEWKITPVRLIQEQLKN